MSQNDKEIYEFGPFRLDVVEHLFIRKDGVKNGHLPEKAFQTLCVLLRNRGHLVTKQELLDQIWPDSFVEANNLDKCVHAIRHAIGEKPGEQKYIETVRKHGYRFVAETTGARPPLPSDGEEASEITRFLVHTPGKAQQARPDVLIGFDLEKIREYRRAGEYANVRDYAEKCLKDFQISGDQTSWAEAYRQIALSHFWEGNCVKSLECFEFGIEDVREKASATTLCKIYTDIAGILWHLRRPKEGIDYLEQAVAVTDPHDLTPNTVVALNNLGILQTLIGEWTKAEETLDYTIKLAEELNERIPATLDSLAELKMLKGEYSVAQQLLERSIVAAREERSESSAVPAMRNLARCLLAQRHFKEASAKADETIYVCQKIGEARHANMARLVVAESCLYQGGLKECEHYLRSIETSDLSYDFYVLGSIQRIRGLASLEIGDRDLAIQHFIRCRSIFEKASDRYNTALADYLIGSNLASGDKELASRHLGAAAEVFETLGIAFSSDNFAERLSTIPCKIAE